jgi:hypothetical protein
MATGRSRKSLSRSKKGLKRREENRRQFARRNLRMETLEERRLLAVGPQLVGVQPNQGDLLDDGDIRNVAPQELTFHFSEGQVIDQSTLDAIRVTGSGFDFQFDAATARTDFNTNGQVVVEFSAKTPGPNGNEISLLFSKRDMGGPAAPVITVEGKTIFVELNTNQRNQTTADDLVSVLNANLGTRDLLQAVVVSGTKTTNIASPSIIYSPVDLRGANTASATTDFNTGTKLEVTFTAVQSGPEGNGLTIEFTKRDFGGAGDPLIDVDDDGVIHVELNTNANNQTTAEQLVSAFNANAQARALAIAANPVGSPTTNIATPAITYSPLVLGGANDVVITPGYVGLGDSAREVVFRFAEPLPDDLYRIDVQGVGSSPLRNDLGFALGDTTDDQIDNGADFSLQFELDLGAQILGVVPQPIVRTSNGVLSMSSSQIEVYFNDDDLNPISATNPAFYQLIHTRETVETGDDVVYHPIAVQYFPESDRAMLTFRAPLHQLGSGQGTFRLRVGTDEDAPAPPVMFDLVDEDAGSSFDTAKDLDTLLTAGNLTGSVIVSSSIDPQVYTLEMPGSNDEPGHRSIPEQIETHLLQSADSDAGITTVFYNFRNDYGKDPSGNKLSNLISEEQKQRAREIFEIFGQELGVQFVETGSQGITIVTGDLRALDPEIQTGTGGVIGLSGASPITGQPTIIMDAAENWYDAFGASDDPLRPESWFETTMHEVGHQLGLGHTYELPPGTLMGEEPELGFGVPPEPVYPGDHDIVHGRHLYRAEGKDVDLYRFSVTQSGLFMAETLAERQADASLLDTVLRLYRQDGEQWELVASNDDYYSNDSFLQMTLEPGSYAIGVSAAGNEQYNPLVADTGFGGTSEGSYDLRLTFRENANSSILDVDNALNEDADAVSRATALDGDGDGLPGGVFNFWFRVDATPIIVDKAAPAGGTGNLTSPYRNIDDALLAARSGDVVRIVGNGGADGQLATPDDAAPYEIGFDRLSRPLEDGSKLDVPRGVTVVFDRGAVVKARRARIGVGSSSPTIDRSGGALQVWGVPRLVDLAGQVIRDEDGNVAPGSVYFTSLNDESLGGDSDPAVPTTPQAGEWGGLVFRNDVDRAVGRFDWEQEGIFLDYVNQADIRYGGGTVVIDSVPQTIAPIHATDARPTITHNTITNSADAAISANPDSFEESTFHAPRFQTVAFTSDYTRVGPEVHGNRLLDNSINGLFVRTQTPSGDGLEEMTVPGRWDDTDVVHVVSENLRIEGNPGGPVQLLKAPDAKLVTLKTQPGGTVPVGIVDYKITFVDADGNEGPASDPTASVLVSAADPNTELTASVRLENLPLPSNTSYTRRLYRAIKTEYVLVAELDATSRTYVDDGTTAGGLLQGSTIDLTPRLHGRLAIDPGTIVKLNGAGIETGFGAQLIAEGVDGGEVVFTSLQDVRYGAGGTYATSDRGAAASGDWTGLYIGHTGTASLDFAVLAYGGGIAEVAGSFAGFNALEIHQADARVTNSRFEFNNAGVGGQASPNRDGRGPNSEALIFVRGAQPILVDNTLVGNSGHAISIDVNSLNHELVADHGRSTGAVSVKDHIVDNQGPMIRGNRLADNDFNGLQVRGGTLTTQGVWDDTDIAHVILDETIYVPDFHTYGGLRLESSGTESLVVKLQGPNAGFTATGRPLDITDRIGGILQIIGQPGFPVVLTSIQDDRVSAGFRPDGTPQGDTNNNGNPFDEGDSAFPLLPTGPEVNNGLVIDNDVPLTTPGFFEVQPAAGGAINIGPNDRVTALGNTQLYTGVDFIFNFLNYVDVGAGTAQLLDATTITVPPTLQVNPLEDIVVSEGNFLGNAGQQINWRVESRFDDGTPIYYNTVTFTTNDPNQTLGDLQFANYLDEDVTVAFDILATTGTPGQADFRAFTLGDLDRVGFSHGGVYEAGPDLVNATYDGWAADVFPLLDLAVAASTATYSIPGDINLANLPAVPDPDFGTVYGPRDVTTAFAWSVDPTANTATITSFLELLPRDPTLVEPDFSGDWRSIELLEYTHDRNVRVSTERETGNATISGINETAEDAQFLGELAPHEKAADDNRRLGFEVHGTLNRPSDVDVYSFDAVAGTEVWLDIDRTTHALDTVLELIDGNGSVLARSNDSGAEAADPSLLYRDPVVMDSSDVNPLAKSSSVGEDLWTTNPRDAGFRVILPGPTGTTNTYHLRVRSNSDDLSDLDGGVTRGVYQLQIRLQELDEIGGASIEMADIRYATNGIELSGLPAHSPLTGEAAEVLDATGTDDNDSLATADVLGNLLNSDRGTISVAGKIAAANDVDWFQFDVTYDSIQAEGSLDPRHLSTVFDIDYADGFARANTNLWVFDEQGQLVLVGRDSNTPEDRPADTDGSIDDLSRGSVGALDPYIGPVELPATGFTSGRYYVAVSSNAQLPDQLDQFLTANATNPFVRLEPVNSVRRIAEDHIDSPENYTTAERPQIPLLFGDNDEVSLFVPDGTELRDGEIVTITTAAGDSVTYEFDADGNVTAGHIAVAYEFGYSRNEVALALAEAIADNPPDSVLDFDDPLVPTAGSPVVLSSVAALPLGGGRVALREFVFVQTLLNEVTTTDFLTSQLIVRPITRSSTYTREPTVRQAAAPGEVKPTVFVSRPAVVPYDLGDVTMFVSDTGFFGDDSTELLSVDPFTGQVETRIGAFGANVGDIAMHPRGALGGGGLFAYRIPDSVFPTDDVNTGEYWQIDPGTLTSPTTGANLGALIGDAGIETYNEDPATPGAEIRSGFNNKNGVGVLFEAMTFSNAAVDNQVRGFAVGTRGDTFVDPNTGEVFSGALGIPNPANILFEFQPNTGAAINPPNTANRKAAAILTSGGTQIVDRGGLDTTVDAFPAGGANNTITGVDATIVDAVLGTTQVNIEDGDFFEVDQDGDRIGDITFEFDTGPEFFMTVTATQYLVDGDTFIVDGVQFEFDTGTVLIVTAQNGSQLNDGDTITISDNAATPSTMTFEFDNDNNTAGNTAIPFSNTSNQQAIISAIISSINSIGNFGVTAVQLPGSNRITLLGESTVSGVATNAAGINTGNTFPGVNAASIGIPVEETFTADEIGQAIATVIDGTQLGGFQAGAVGNRLNFLGALTANFAGVTNPVFTPGGVQGTLGQFNLPVPFLASDNSADIAGRVQQAVVSAGFDATQSGATVFLDPVTPPDVQPTFVCNSLGTPPLIGAPGVPDCPLQSGGVAPGGQITGIAFLGPQLYAVTDVGGLYRITDSSGFFFNPDSAFNVADYIDGSRELLAAVNEVTTLTLDPVTGELTETTSNEPVRFAGLVAGPQNTEDGLYENLLFGITDTGRMFAFDTFGQPQAVFANGVYHVDTGLNPNGLAFGTLDDNLWHVTDNRDTDPGHGITGAFDGSRIDEDPLGNTSFYFGYEDPTVQPQFGDNAFAPATPADTYDFPGGAHGSLLSNPFSLEGYASADKPTLYFNYFLETEQADASADTTLDDLFEQMRDAFRVYISGDDGQWKLLSTNNSDRDPPPDDDYFDEYDPFDRFDPVTGEFIPEQPFERAETFDTAQWRQARVDLAPYAGQDNLRLRFDFSTAGGLSSGGINPILDLNTAGNQLRAIPGNDLRDGQMFTLTGLQQNPATGFSEYALVAGFEFDMGPTIVAPTGAAIDDGDLFDLDGTIYEFDNNGLVGVTNSVPHTAIEFVGSETAGELALLIQHVLEADPPPPIQLTGDLAAREPNETLSTSFATGLNGTTQVFEGTGVIGDNFDLVDLTMDVDMVQLHLDAGDQVVITTNTARLATQLNSYLRLFDADGNQLAANDNADPTNPFSRDSRIEFTAKDRGTYFVGISAAHNFNYTPTVAGSGSPSGGVVTQGFYEFTIAVNDPVGPVRVGNRLNLPNRGTVTPTGLPDDFVDGALGVSSGLPNPFAADDPSLPDVPVLPVRVNARMTSLDVADAIRTALADHLGNGNMEAIKAQYETVQIVGYGIGDAGPLGISGPSDPATALAGSGLFADLFGAFATSAEFDGQTSRAYPGALRMQDNQYEGVYLDDIVIGFAARGEMVSAPDNAPAIVTQFIANNNQPVGDIDEGAYQLEIRQATEYGLSMEAPDPTLLLYESFDINDRLADGVSLSVSSGQWYRDGQTFTVSDGVHTITLEFNDLMADDGVAAGNTALDFMPGDSATVIARRIRDVINQLSDDGQLDARATASDGTIEGSGSTSPIVHIYGEIAVTVGLTAGDPLGLVPVAEANDTLATAFVTGIVGDGTADFHGRGVIGDNPEIGLAAADVDLFQIELFAGEAVAVDIDAAELGYPLDSVLRVFDAAGMPLFALDQNGVLQPVESDDDIAPGEQILLLPELELNYDSYVAFIAPADGVYYLGVSGFGNEAYDPTVAGSGRAGSTGEYEIHILRPAVSNGLEVIQYEGKGDQNLQRDQGQILIRDNHIRNASEFGILVTAGQRVGDEAPRPGPVRNLSQINTARLAPGVTITNNVLAENALGGIDLNGDPGDTTGLGTQPAAVPFGRVINNTIVGRTTQNGVTLGDVGIRVGANVSPTLLNNVVSNLEIGIDVDPTSTSAVLGGTLYHNNLVNVQGKGLGDFPLIVDPAVQLFVNPDAGNYYPAASSPVIDSALDSLEDRSAMIQIQNPLGIPRSPIKAPQYDASGQLRVDDPSVFPPSGLGENVFKDRGAQDRADFDGPAAKLVAPLDNGANDLDPSQTLVNLFRVSLDQFSIQLVDSFGPLGGIGVDDSTITGDAVRVTRDGQLLTEGTDYSFRYDATNNIIRLTALAGAWEQESNYVIELTTGDRFIVQGQSGDLIAEGDSFQIVDEIGNVVTFEYDTGYVIQVPQTLAVQVPRSGGGAAGVEDGDTITVQQGTESFTVELDNNGVFDDQNEIVQFTANSSQGEIADDIAEALFVSGLGLTPRNVGDGLVSLGVDGSQTLTVVSTNMTQVGVQQGVVDTETFTIDDGGRVVTFEFTTDPRVAVGNIPVPFSYADTHDEVAESISLAINGTALGLNTQAISDGRVQIGGSLNHIVDVTNANLILTGEPGATLAWGLRIPTLAGSFQDLIADGETFTITSGTGTTVTFELDDNQDFTPGNTVLPFTGATTTAQLANTIVSRIRNAGLGLYPFNAGNGIVVLGGDNTYSMDVQNTSLTEVGLPGEPAAVPVRFTPDESFTAEDVAEVTAEAINDRHLPGVSAVANGDMTVITGAADVTGVNVEFVSGIKDYAGNLLSGNQVNGDTRFTIFIGAGMDYGDAPAPYPTLRAENGARHVILPGFSLGATVDINADGQPSTGADGDDRDGDDEDGVLFDSATPLIPNRRYNITVSTSGIGTGADAVVPFGALDAWIDFNRDGDWNDPNERILSGIVLNPSVLNNGLIQFRDLVVPANAVPGDTYARFRLSTTGNLSPAGEASAGEVEDYLVTIIANPWHNPTNGYDVNNSGSVSPIDLLLQINYINANGPGVLPVPRPVGMPFLDVSNDGLMTNVDILQQITELNRLNESGGEGEAPVARAKGPATENHLRDILDGEDAWLDMVADVDQATRSSGGRDAFFADLGT